MNIDKPKLKFKKKDNCNLYVTSGCAPRGT